MKYSMLGRGSVNFLFGVAIVGIAALFFLPELSSVNKAIGHFLGLEKIAEKKPEASEDKLTEPLNKVMNKFDSGSYGQPPQAVVGTQQVAKEGEGGLSSWLNSVKATLSGSGSLSGAGMGGGANGQGESLKKMRFPSGIPPWQILHSSRVVGGVRLALHQSREFQKGLRPSYTKSRYALLNYVNGLEFFLKREAEQIPPEEMMRYLANLDMQVTYALMNDRLGATEYEKWRVISLGPIVESYGANRLKETYVPPFLAAVLLTKVEVREHLSPQGQSLPVPLFDVTFWGVVQGKEAKSIQLAGNNRWIETHQLGGERGKQEYKDFSFSVTRTREKLFTVRVLDNEGGFYDKYYQLVGAAKRFPRGNDGRFGIALIDLSNPDLPVDTRLDRVFWNGKEKGSGLTEAIPGDLVWGIPGNSFDSGGKGPAGFSKF